MPFEKTVPDEKIIAQFDRDDLARRAYTYSEVAEGVEELTAEAVRQRLKKMDGNEVESVKIGNTRLWYKAGVGVLVPEPSNAQPAEKSADEMVTDTVHQSIGPVGVVATLLLSAAIAFYGATSLSGLASGAAVATGVFLFLFVFACVSASLGVIVGTTLAAWSGVKG